MTHVTSLQIGDGHADVTLACGHVQHVDRWYSNLRPGTAYDCPDCRVQDAETLAERFTSVELARLRFWRNWIRKH